MRKNTPCKECKFRRPGCHSSCELYKRWKERNDERTKLIREEREKENVADGYRADQCYEWHKIRRR